MATPNQLVSYINVLKAKSRTMRYKGRLVKAYMIPGTPEYLEVQKARKDLAALLGYKEEPQK